MEFQSSRGTQRSPRTTADAQKAKISTSGENGSFEGWSVWHRIPAEVNLLSKLCLVQAVLSDLQEFPIPELETINPPSQRHHRHGFCTATFVCVSHWFLESHDLSVKKFPSHPFVVYLILHRSWEGQRCLLGKGGSCYYLLLIKLNLGPWPGWHCKNKWGNALMWKPYSR